MVWPGPLVRPNRTAAAEPLDLGADAVADPAVRVSQAAKREAINRGYHENRRHPDRRLPKSSSNQFLPADARYYLIMPTSRTSRPTVSSSPPDWLEKCPLRRAPGGRFRSITRPASSIFPNARCRRDAEAVARIARCSLAPPATRNPYPRYAFCPSTKTMPRPFVTRSIFPLAACCGRSRAGGNLECCQRHSSGCAGNPRLRPCRQGPSAIAYVPRRFQTLVVRVIGGGYGCAAARRVHGLSVGRPRSECL